MNVWTYACLVVGLLLVVAPVGALVPDTIAISTDPEWVTAGSGESATVTVQVSNSTSGNTSFEGVAIDFEVDGEYGSISPARVGIDSAGRAAAVFKPGTRSGTATITATVSGEGLDEPLMGSVDLYIDHAAPYGVADILYTPRVTAGGTTDITVLMVDRYGNLVDSKREDFLNITPETVSFTVGSPGGGATFVGGTDEITVPVDDTGNATVTLEVSTLAGENIVYIQPPKPIRGQYITVRGVADGVPAGITCTVNPSIASVQANGKDTITLMYELTDEYGNPAAGQGLWVNASGLQGQSKCFNSSSRGEVWVTYGPEESVGVVTITATAVANASVTDTTQVEFTSTEPVKMVISASPQTMASRDCNPNVVSELRAKVMDIKGNPVDGEEVTFTIDTGSINLGGSDSTGDPYLGEVEGQNVTTAVTINGSAIVKFHPGSFAKPEMGKKASAKGNVTVWATWDDVSKPIELTWVNYPYLSVETEVSNAKVSVNSTDEHMTNTTYVTIRLKGDGYAMQPDPIDVVLCTDRSGSMLYDNPDRMHSVREAAKLFVDNMSERDSVGLVTFGRNTGSRNQINVPGEKSFGRNARDYINNNYITPKKYLDYATVDQPLTNVLSSVKVELDNIVPDYGTPMRGGIYKTINELSVNGSSDAVKAVILLSDGDYNWYGDPLARGNGYSSSDYGPTAYGDLSQSYYKFSGLSNAEQNLSVYARHKNVTIYSIGYADSISSGGRATLKKLAESTGGKYYNGSAANIGAVYTAIAGELKTEAGVDTNMTVFENVEINGTPIAAFEVFDYKHEPGKSTTIKGWVNNETGDFPDIPPFTTIDQTDAWKQDKQLHFDIGTIRLGQTWETTFCLAVNASYRAGEENNINIFGPGSTISFNGTEDGTEELDLPDTYITVFPDLTNTGITSSSLAVRFTGPGTGSGPYTDLVPLNWTTAYKGTEEVDISLAYSRYEDMRSPTTFFTKTLPPGSFVTADNTTTDSTMMPVKDLSPGQYWITVTASARDAETDEDTINVWAHTKGAPRAYIKIG
ncbi:von Willebrand factor, type A [Methanoculleus bourgensis MS2]|uniref:von Willebrand factor, type A n=1 Tax=Methanoculleus bourgensis (strain ATCC 43281 / DSM 3045 / OCM 15 / MS2) TaxID=1201294 RepID=I7L013_METBM|nr:vWA domain-containing protein [Methanoculleus bourgensis]CCJ36590.1 von Willebrand factor, type A [Methanoculleus bourgensis MS2]